MCYYRVVKSKWPGLRKRRKSRLRPKSTVKEPFIDFYELAEFILSSHCHAVITC
jgi:hypothetical protein